MTRHCITWATIGVCLFFFCGQWPSPAAAQTHVDIGPVHVHVGDRPQPPAAAPAAAAVSPAAAAMEVLTRGPIHEAFAQPVVWDQGAAFTTTVAPPPPIEEVIPDEKPAGNHVVWVPGYWSWDSDRNDYIWVSGCWRAVPPNTSWIPGYWAQVGGGYQWVPGFWTAANTEEVEYLPAPPASLEAGPQGTPPSPDSIWIPGCWVYQNGRYAWRSGFWQPAQANWVWEPAHYVCAPRGCVYVDGYWDYPLNRRGVAFLPIYAPPSVYGQPGFRFSPQIALDLGGMVLNLFSSPGRHAYYFGDYYDAQYGREGFYPWYEARDRHDYYDPIFVHQQWRHRDDRQWFQHQREGYDLRRDDKSLRPARTYQAMQAQVARLPEKDRAGAEIGSPMAQVIAEKNAPLRYESVDDRTREFSAGQTSQVHAYKGQRAQWESASAAAAKAEPAAKEVAAPEKALTPQGGPAAKEAMAAKEAQPEKVRIPKSPIAAREATQDKELTPPPRPEHPKADPTVQPKASKVEMPDRSQERRP